MTPEEWTLMLERLSVNNNPEVRMREFRKCVDGIIQQEQKRCEIIVDLYVGRDIKQGVLDSIRRIVPKWK